MEMIGRFIPNADYATQDIAEIISEYLTNDRPGDNREIIEIRTEGYERVVYCEDVFAPRAKELLEAWSTMVDLLSPGGGDILERKLPQLTRLQSLIMSNLQCVEPALKPALELYDETGAGIEQG